MLTPQNKTRSHRRRFPNFTLIAILTSVAIGPVHAEGLNLGGIKVNLGASDGGISAGVSVGSNVSVGATVGGGSVASADAQIGNSVSLNTEVGGASLIGADVSVGGSGGNSGGGNTGTDDGIGGGTNPGTGIPVSDLSGMTFGRDATRSVCGTAGNFAAINGVSVFAQDGVRLGTIVGAYIANQNLVRLRVMVDTDLVPGSGCVEYSTNNGEVRPEGIVLRTSSALLVASLAQ